MPCPTFKAAAVAVGVLEDDTEHYRCLEEAAVCAAACQMRSLYLDILINADVQDPLQLWEAHKLHMVDGFLCNAQQVTIGLALAVFAHVLGLFAHVLGVLNIHLFCFLNSVPPLFADAHLPATASGKDLDEGALHNTSLLYLEALYNPLPILTVARLFAEAR